MVELGALSRLFVSVCLSVCLSVCTALFKLHEIVCSTLIANVVRPVA